jgi:TonB family protein
LIAPGTANARSALLEARKLDPTEPTVAQGIRSLSASLTEEARQALTAGKPKEAQVFVDAARQLGAAGAALAVVERQLADANRAPSTTPATVAEPPTRPAPPVSAAPNVESLIAEARQRIADGRLIEPAGSSARESLASLRSAAPNRAENEELTHALTMKLIEASQQAIAGKSYERAEKLLASARESGDLSANASSRELISNTELELAAARERGSTETLQAAGLPRTREVSAQYPRQALASGIEGWVDLDFTISPEGIPGDISIRNSRPKRTFDRAALDALRQWRFVPIVRDGAPVAQGATLRMSFKP